MHREVRRHAGRPAGAGIARLVAARVPDEELDRVAAALHRPVHAVLRIRRRPRRGLTQIVDAETRAVQQDVAEVVIGEPSEVECRAGGQARPVEIERVGIELAQLGALRQVRLVGRPRDVQACSLARVWQDGPASGNAGDQVGISAVDGEVIIDPVRIDVRARGVGEIGLRWNGEGLRDQADH